MNKLSDEKLTKLCSMSSQGGFWYITKQNLVFRDLCFMAKILEKWDDRKDENYQTFFDKYKVLPEYGEFPPLTAHRATKNCEYIGLIRQSDKYTSQSLTPFYFSLKKLCNGDFNKLLQYPKIIDRQLERIYINAKFNIPYTETFQICPFMFLFKILLLIGDITGSYIISTSEFKLFVATAQKWNEYFEVTESILRYRNDSNFKSKCDANSSKVADVRYNVLAQNHSQLEVTKTNIAIKKDQIKNIRRKVSEYELSEIVQSSEDMYKASTCLSSFSDPLQQIFYGAPGTGKSHKIKNDEDVKAADEKNLVFRTTFHPDSDYSTFVGAYKPTMQPVADKYKAVAGKDEEITYLFVPQAFLQAYIAAWNNPEENVYLVIEEINRGNCAQIFGDLFQLLDRDGNGCSEYPIVADKDLAKYLKEGKDKEGHDVLINKGGIKDGKLKLPKNLYIWATMNTSDQSLFPIDSAFKRRWDWVYVPIDTKKENWHIKVGVNHYSWSTFLEKINNEILTDETAEDKHLGFYFCKADNNVISQDTFVSKVLFYLWTDVFKVYGIPSVIGSSKDWAYTKFYNPDGKVNEEKVQLLLQKIGVDVVSEDDEEEVFEDERSATNVNVSSLLLTYNGISIKEKDARTDYRKVISLITENVGVENVAEVIPTELKQTVPTEKEKKDKGFEPLDGQDGWFLAVNNSNSRFLSLLKRLKEKLELNLNSPLF